MGIRCLKRWRLESREEKKRGKLIMDDGFSMEMEYWN